MKQKKLIPKLQIVPELDPHFCPFNLLCSTYEKQATKQVTIALERNDGVSVFTLHIFDDGFHDEEDWLYAERRVKLELWQKGGFRLYVCGAPKLCARLKYAYSDKGERSFDFHFMSGIYDRTMEVLSCTEEQLPKPQECPQLLGGHLDGCRIGFDAGGSTRKVTAIQNGKTVFSERIPWEPKRHKDWKYHEREVSEGLRSAAAHLPCVDAIGISTAGVLIDNCVKVSSLFLALPEEDRKKHGETLFSDVARTVADVPCAVCNDGEVGALAAGMNLQKNRVLSISMGTSVGVGYLDSQGHLTGWLNEMAFAPVDLGPERAQDEWSGDWGVGCKYLSQDAIVRLAERAAISFDPEMSTAEKTMEVQHLLDQGNEKAAAVYRSVGVYLGHTLPLYQKCFDCREVLLMGGVVSGSGGELILQQALQVLKKEYPETNRLLHVQLLSRELCQVGQSMAAASLPARR